MDPKFFHWHIKHVLIQLFFDDFKIEDSMIFDGMYDRI